MKRDGNVLGECLRGSRLVAGLPLWMAVVPFSARGWGQGDAPGPTGALTAEEVAREMTNPNTPPANLTLEGQHTNFDGDRTIQAIRRTGHA